MTYLQERINSINWVDFGTNLSLILTVVGSIIIWFNRNVAKITSLKGQMVETENLMVYVKAILKDHESVKSVIKQSNKDVLLELSSLKVELRELRNAIKILMKEKEK